jgi:hypothetical protein
MAEEKNPVGRPTEYRREYAKQVRKITRLGATRAEIAEFFEVDGATIHRWMEKHPEFRTAIRLGKTWANKRVGESLYHRALGYSHESVKIMTLDETTTTKAANGKEVSVTRKVVHKEPFVEHYPPDTTACIFWLKNRQPDEWRDVTKIEKTVTRIDVGSRDTLNQQLKRALEKRTRTSVQ